MDKVKELLDKLEDLGKLVPKLDSVTEWTQWLISMAVRVGPICILVLGLIYLLIPPKEANHKAGYRTYFGMGSVIAWRYTQRIAGAIMTVTGLILTLVARKAVGTFEEMTLLEMGKKAFDLIKAQVICALVIYIFMALLTAVLFDRKGYCRFGTKNRKPKKNAGKVPEIKEVPQEQLPEQIPEQIPEEEDPQIEYERQGEQVITADDIVIEGLD